MNTLLQGIGTLRFNNLKKPRKSDRQLLGSAVSLVLTCMLSFMLSLEMKELLHFLTFPVISHLRTKQRIGRKHIFISMKEIIAGLFNLYDMNPDSLSDFKSAN